MKEEYVENHTMHREYFEVTKKVWHTIQKAKQENRRIIAVGTTSARTLEALAIDPPTLDQSTTYTSSTDIFITPGYTWKIATGLLTNFHLPKSSLLILVSSLLGQKQALQYYKEAIQKQYRFYSYGDAMLIL